MLELKKCPICKNEGDFKVIKSFCKNSDFVLYLCNNCISEFWEPRIAPDKKWYQTRNPHRFISFEGGKIYRGYHKKFLKDNKQINGKKILDLGCGSGEFLANINKIGADVWGVDLDEDAINIGKKYFGLKNVFSASFEDFFKKINGKKFDIITAFEVLEHLEDPSMLLYLIKDSLNKFGRVVISVPSRERFFVNNNSWDFPPHHLNRWNGKALKIFLENNGFKVDKLLYVEEFKILMGSIDGIFRTGLVNKTFSKNGKKNIIFSRILYVLAKVKQWVIAVVPATILWIFGKAIGRKNGIIYAELSLIKE